MHGAIYVTSRRAAAGHYRVVGGGATRADLG
jgi:hypothetical protein